MKALDKTCLIIRDKHRQRSFAMEQRKRADLSLGAFIRLNLGWHKDLPSEESKRLLKQASDIQKGKEEYEPLINVIEASKQSSQPMKDIEKASEKEMVRLVKELDVYDLFVEPVNGFGGVGLAIIIGEAGNLSNYPKKGHLWKRMGVAVLDGIAQGRLSKGASAEDWIEHGYNPLRRSKMFTIGDSLIKKQNKYREMYLERKVYEKTRAEMQGVQVMPAARITAKNKDVSMSEGHVHRRSQRYMEQRLLRDLLSAWKVAA